jgi:hypothetical protein
VVWGDANNGAVLLMETDIVLLEVAAADAIEVPEFCKAGDEWAWDGEEGFRGKGGVGEVEDVVGYDEDGEEKQVHFELLECYSSFASFDLEYASERERDNSLFPVRFI